MRKTRRGDRVPLISRWSATWRGRRAARRERWHRRLLRVRAARRGVGSVLLLGYLAVLGYLTLGRFHQVNPGYNLVPGRTIAHDVAVGGVEFVINTLGNVVATLPLGILLPIALPRWAGSALRVAIASFGTSLLIEVAQGVLGSRVADVDDLILNTLGGWLGYGLLRGYRRWFAQKA